MNIQTSCSGTLNCLLNLKFILWNKYKKFRDGEAGINSINTYMHNEIQFNILGSCHTLNQQNGYRIGGGLIKVEIIYCDFRNSDRCCNTLQFEEERNRGYSTGWTSHVEQRNMPRTWYRHIRNKCNVIKWITLRHLDACFVMKLAQVRSSWAATRKSSFASSFCF